MKLFKLLGIGCILVVLVMVFGTMYNSIPQKEQENETTTTEIVKKVKANKDGEILKKGRKGEYHYIVVWDELSEYTIVYYIDEGEWDALNVGDIYQPTARQKVRGYIYPLTMVKIEQRANERLQEVL